MCGGGRGDPVIKWQRLRRTLWDKEVDSSGVELLYLGKRANNRLRLVLVINESPKPERCFIDNMQAAN